MTQSWAAHSCLFTGGPEAWRAGVPCPRSHDEWLAKWAQSSSCSSTGCPLYYVVPWFSKNLRYVVKTKIQERDLNFMSSRYCKNWKGYWWISQAASFTLKLIVSQAWPVHLLPVELTIVIQKACVQVTALGSQESLGYWPDLMEKREACLGNSCHLYMKGGTWSVLTNTWRKNIGQL